jgi:hypothetical protein
MEVWDILGSIAVQYVAVECNVVVITLGQFDFTAPSVCH